MVENALLNMVMYLPHCSYVKLSCGSVDSIAGTKYLNFVLWVILPALTCKNYMSWYWKVIFDWIYQCQQTIQEQWQSQNAHEPIFLAGVFSVVCSVLQQLKQLQEKNHQILCMPMILCAQELSCLSRGGWLILQSNAHSTFVEPILGKPSRKGVRITEQWVVAWQAALPAHFACFHWPESLAQVLPFQTECSK